MIVLILYVSFLNSAIAFIPSPLVKFAGRASNSITHQGITKKGFTRTLHHFLKDIEPLEFSHDDEAPSMGSLLTRYYSNSRDASIVENVCSVFGALEVLVRNNALQDIRISTRHDPVVHFDSEKIHEANRRLINGRRKIIEAAYQGRFDIARVILGGLLHTLQDFYSHTNWIELGNRKPLYNLGLSTNIGEVAKQTESTCTNSGCRVIVKKCDIIQRMVFRKCPLVYYSCENNLDANIQQTGKLTSGYVSTVNLINNNKDSISPKPVDFKKCSHGGIMDDSANFDAIGGINKDTGDEIYSPHYYFHKDAAQTAILATEYFLTYIRKEMGTKNFANLIYLKLKNRTESSFSNVVEDECEHHCRTNHRQQYKKQILKCISLSQNYWGETTNINDIKFDSVNEGIKSKDDLFVDTFKFVMHKIKRIAFQSYNNLFNVNTFEENVEDTLDENDCNLDDSLNERVISRFDNENDINAEMASDVPSVHCGTNELEALIYKMSRLSKFRRSSSLCENSEDGHRSSIAEL
ncbi:hypothetical protein GJ496_002816 [Pomphorhynchus laevis]|nr:hypothetical protein GJ496_002816 [Pomphorhynchus laevis]